MPVLDTKTWIPGLGDGQPGSTTLSGSGFAVPAGLEAILEYNGLFLNATKNVDRYKLTSIDGLFDADIRDSRDANTSEDGETPYNSFYGGRTIVLNGRIETYSISKLRDMQQALRAAFADLTIEYPLRFMTGDFTKDHVIYCKKINSMTSSEQQINGMVQRDFQISLRASNPRFLSFYQNFFELDPAPVTFFPIRIATLLNRGTYWAQPIYRIYGPSSRATITNEETEKSFTVSAIPAYGYFEFDPARKTLRDNNGKNQWNFLADGSDYVYLKGGENGAYNRISYSGDASRIGIMWRDSWM